MFRNQYDTDVTVWSPEGRLLQVRRIVNDVSEKGGKGEATTNAKRDRKLHPKK